MLTQETKTGNPDMVSNGTSGTSRPHCPVTIGACATPHPAATVPKFAWMEIRESPTEHPGSFQPVVRSQRSSQAVARRATSMTRRGSSTPWPWRG